MKMNTQIKEQTNQCQCLFKHISDNRYQTILQYRDGSAFFQYHQNLY